MSENEKALLETAKDITNAIEDGECFVDKDELQFLFADIDKMRTIVEYMLNTFNEQ